MADKNIDDKLISRELDEASSVVEKAFGVNMSVALIVLGVYSKRYWREDQYPTTLDEIADCIIDVVLGLEQENTIVRTHALTIVRRFQDVYNDE